MTTPARIKKPNFNYDVLDYDEFKKRIALAKKGDSIALDELIVQFLPLIKSVALTLVKKGVYLYYSLDDLIQEGSIGFLDAIKKVEDDVGSVGRFIVYAKTRILGQMIDAVREYDIHGRLIRSGCKIYRVTLRKLEQQLSREPRMSEIKTALPEKYKDLFDEIRLIVENELVMSETLSDYENDSLLDLIPGIDKDSLYVDQHIDTLRLIQEIITGNNKILTAKEKFTLYSRYVAEIPLTFKEVGAVHGSSESAACYLEGSALRKIRKRLKITKTK